MRIMPLVVWIGKSKPKEALESLTRWLQRVDVTSDIAEGDGLQITFSLHQSRSNDFDILSDQLVEPFSRIRIGVLQGTTTLILFDGVITHHQISVNEENGNTDLTIMGRDLGVMLDLVEKRRIFKNQRDSVIAENILKEYGNLGLTPDITDTSDTPDENDVTRHQYGTDQSFLRMLAERYGNVFYIEPVDTKGSRAYFGPERRAGAVLPVLSCNMGHLTNVESMQFTNNAFQPVTATATYIDLEKQQLVSVSQDQSNRQPLSKTPTPPRRILIAPGAAKLKPARVDIALRALVDKNANAVIVEGSLDTSRYEAVLRPHWLVDVRGAGATFSGRYYVQRVTHSIQQRYTQSFKLSREGTGATAKVMS